MRLGLRFIRQGEAVTLARGRWVLKTYPQSTESYWTAGGCLKYAATNEWFIAQRVALTTDPH